MGKQEDKKASQQRKNSTFLEAPNSTQRNDNGKMPLVIFNDEAEDGEEKTNDKPVDRKRSRGISIVSMHSNSNADVQSGAVRISIKSIFIFKANIQKIDLEILLNESYRCWGLQYE